MPQYLGGLGLFTLIEVINMLVNFVTEFLFQKFVVYRGTIDTNELAKKEQA